MVMAVKGLLVTNGFVQSDKFFEIYSLLMEAGKRLSVSMEMKSSSQLCCAVGTEMFERKPDFVLFFDKDIMLARRIEQLGIPVFNSADAIEQCDNKAYTEVVLANSGIKTPKTYISPKTYENLKYNNLDFARKACSELGFPLVVKESFGSFGKQVFLAEDFASVERLIKSFSARPFLIQELVKTSFGRDVRVNVVGGKVRACMLRFSVTGDFRSNITAGGHMKPYEVSEEQAAAAIDACRVLKLDFAGVDVLFGEDNAPVICEVNSNPHFKSTLDCTGVNLAECIIEHIISRVSA